MVFPRWSSALTLKGQKAFRMINVLLPLSFPKMHVNVYWRFLILSKMYFPDQFCIHTGNYQITWLFCWGFFLIVLSPVMIWGTME